MRRSLNPSSSSQAPPFPPAHTGYRLANINMLLMILWSSVCESNQDETTKLGGSQGLQGWSLGRGIWNGSRWSQGLIGQSTDGTAVKEGLGCSSLGHSEDKFGVTSFGSLLLQTWEGGWERWPRHTGAETDYGDMRVTFPLLPFRGDVT